MSEVEAEISMFERIGGAVVVDRLVEAFYRRMDALHGAWPGDRRGLPRRDRLRLHPRGKARRRKAGASM